ncbi:MAG: type I restriction enzyme, S subunit [Candidatus Methanomarinus sp.]|nr:MAG: type I restriction enzyme, S subunit [ANME-2 cluster archaeon]
MSDLLTRGIDEEGRIRSEETHEFKDSPLGRVPEGWDVTTLLNVVGDKNDLIIAGPFGSNLKVEDYRDEGIPIIRLQNIDFGKFLNKDIKYISPEKANELSYHSFIKGDIVLAKLGDPIGKTCIIPHFLKRGVVVSDVVRIRVDSKFSEKKFIFHCLNSFSVFYQLNKDIIGTTRPRVNLDQVRNLLIPFPPLPEQHHITEILTAADTYIEKEQTYLNKLQQIKKGLMQDLLTGKVRVTTALAPPKPAEAAT